MKERRQGIIVSIINWVAIIFAISFKMTIVPYMVFSPIQYSNFFILVLIAFEIIALIANYSTGRRLQFGFLRFFPLSCYFILWLIQLLIVFVLFNEKYIGAGLFYALNDFLLCVLICSNIEAIIKLKPFDFVPREYTLFAFLNALLVTVSAVLMTVGVLAPLTNEVNSMCVLFEGNVETGQTYFWPGYLSIEIESMRLSEFGELTGLTFEPHLLCLLIFPAFFFLIPVVKKQKLIIKIAFLFVFVVAGIYGFSVTSFLALSVCIFLLILRSARHSLAMGVLFLLVIAFITYWFWDVFVQSVVVDYTRDKMFESTNSADYSKNNLALLFSPDSVIGGGIMFWPLYQGEEPNIGFVSFVFVVLFYVSSYFYCFRMIFSRDNNLLYIGLGVLYMMLHGMKLASSIFYMPFVAMCLCFLFYANRTRLHLCSSKKINKYESIKSYK